MDKKGGNVRGLINRYMDGTNESPAYIMMDEGMKANMA